MNGPRHLNILNSAKECTTREENNDFSSYVKKESRSVLPHSEAHLEPNQISRMEFLAKIVNG